MLKIRHLNNQKGMAAVEMIPIVIVILLILGFSFGFFGVIHSGILNSMAARNYAFETFNHRADLKYFRTNSPADISSYYGNHNFRLHAIVSEKTPSNVARPPAMATARPIIFGWSFGEPDELGNTSGSKHSTDIFSIKDDGTRNSGKEGVNPVWIQTAYGICLTAKCEP